MRNNTLYMAGKVKAWGKASRKSLGTQYKKDYKPSMVVQTWNPCTQKPRNLQVQGQLELHLEILFQDNKKEKGRKKKKRKKPLKIFASWYVCLYVVPSHNE